MNKNVGKMVFLIAVFKLKMRIYQIRIFNLSYQFCLTFYWVGCISATPKLQSITILYLIRLEVDLQPLTHNPY